MNGPNNGIVLYHYNGSPYARRVVWYLQLRGIGYAECRQPPVLPRPDLKRLNVNYRRIPLMAIGRDIYCDTRAILRKLEQLFPEGKLGKSGDDQAALERLLEYWAVEGGLFARAAQLIPTDSPLMKDPTFQKDREELSGRPWSKEAILKLRPEALAVLRNGFKLLETTLLADGRDWVLKTEKPGLADIEAVWVFHWLKSMPGSLPSDLFSDKQYPKVNAWIERFNKEVTAAKGNAPKPASLKGSAAVQRILAAEFADTDLGVDSADPLGLERGQEVEVYPIDSGSAHRDRGRLVLLSIEEVAVEKQVEGTIIRVHFPRSGFRIVVVDGKSKL